MSLGNLQVGVNCTECGKGAGTPASDGRNRCTTCGRFAEEADNYCLKHDVDIDRLPADYTFCPKCREENRISQMQQERMARRSDPNMHSMVDARRR